VPYADVYIGPLSTGGHPLDWGGEKRPAAFRPYSDPNYVFFPPSSPAAFFELLDRIRSEEVQARRIDWGCWAAKMSKKKIIDFIEDVYADSPHLREPPATNSDLVWCQRLQELIAFVRRLPDDEFAVIAIENG
jgi:hypothetical protein